MLLSKALASSHWLVLCLALCTVSTIHSQEAALVSIEAHDKDHFIVRNNSHIPFDLEFTDKDGTKVKKLIGLIRRGKKKQLKTEGKTMFVLSRKNLGDNPTIWWRYTLESLTKQLKKEYRRLVNLGVSTASIDEMNKELEKHRILIYDEDINNSKNQYHQAINDFATIGKNIFSVWLRNKYNRNKEIQEKKICDRIVYYTNLYQATNTDDPKYFYNPNKLTENDKYRDKEVNVDNIFSIGLILFKGRLGDNWGTKASGLLNVPYELLYARKLWNGFQFGEDTYVSLYGFASHDRYVHDIMNEDKTFFAGRDYVDNPSQDFTEIVSNDQIALRTNQISAGFFVRFNTFNQFNLDFGAGYNAYEWASVHFFEKNKDGNSINHLANGEIRKNTFTNVVDYENTSRFYGLAGISWSGMRSSKRSRVRALEFFFRAKFWQRNLQSNDNFQIFEQQAGVFEKISITDGAEFFYTMNFGLSYAW